MIFRRASSFRLLNATREAAVWPLRLRPVDILFQSSFNAADRYSRVSHDVIAPDDIAKSFRCIRTDAAAIVRRPMALIDVAL